MSQRANIKLYFSNAVEQLASQLADNLKTEQQNSSNLLVPQQVIVPNANMQRYLQLFMASKQGICANMEFPFLEAGLSQYLAALETTQQPIELLSQQALMIRIFAQLSDAQWLNKKVNAPLLRYLSGTGSSQLLSIKKWQLSRRLAILLINYELQRPEMVSHWLTGDLHFKFSQDEQLKALERLQKNLYLQVTATRPDSNEQTLYQRFQQLPWSAAQDQHQALHLFTPSRLSACHRQLLCQLGRFYAVNIYQLNVCCEYWEDVQTQREDAWLAAIQARPLVRTSASGRRLQANEVEVSSEVFTAMDDSDIENPLLKAWAKPGREALRLFSQLEDDAVHLDVHYSNDWLAATERNNEGMLQAIQDGILHRQSAIEVVRRPEQLTSLQLARAPSLQREVEAVYNNILWNLQQDPDLQLTDVAVLVTDMAAYRFVIEQVFAEKNQQHQQSLSYSLIDSSVQTESLLAQAVSGLLAVLEDDFMRPAVFKWLANACVQQALEIGAEQVNEWLDWASRLGIYRGFDHLYEATDEQLQRRFTWQQGLQRLRQALVVSGPDELSQDASQIGQLCWIIEGLHEWRAVLQQQHNALRWQQLIMQLLDSYIMPPEGQDKELLVRQAINESLQQLVHDCGDVSLHFAEVKYYLEQGLGDLSASKGSYLSGGVVCAALQPMRPIPFKITYMLGLDEKTFPGQLYQDTLDLTQRTRKIGDINTIENMQYLFLETLICTRQKLYLSYVGQDLVKDEAILPSPVIQTLLNHAESMLDCEALGMSRYPVADIPLDAAARVGFTAVPCHSDWLVNYTPTDYLKYLLLHEPHQVPSFVAQTHAAELPRASTDTTTEAATQDTTEASQHLTVDDLAWFVENPVLNAVKSMGGSIQLLDDQINVAHEPFVMDGLSRHRLFADAIDHFLLQDRHQDKAVDLLTALHDSYRQMAARSQLPIELFADLDQWAMLADEPSWAALNTELADLQALSGPVVFGDGIHDVTPQQKCAPFHVVLQEQQLSLHGSWEQLYQNATGMISHQVVVTSSDVKSRWHKSLIKPFIFWCMAQADPTVKVAENFQLRLIARKKVHNYVFSPVSHGDCHFSTRSNIQAYLGRLLLDSLDKTLTHLPFAVMNALKVSRDDREMMIPYLKPQSRAKVVSAFAYHPSDLSQQERTQLQRQYQLQADQWLHKHSYHELLLALQLKMDPDAVASYRRRLLPLHMMVHAE